ncbi:HNH endonuclease [Bacillaceae bacterium IKA-2]|nr:HNH endonuclease [Bacillaceae bacterium IKA-2]
MKETLKSDAFYKKQQKLEFMDYFGDGYFAACRNIFTKSKAVEIQFNKDICQFNVDELTKLFKALESKSNQSFNTRYHVLYHYLQHYVHLRTDRRNPFLLLNKHEWKKLGIIKTKKKFLSEEELDEQLLDKCKNAQDSCFIQLLFEGLCKEGIIKLKKTDIEWDTNRLNFKSSENKELSLYVSDKCMKLLEAACKQTDYIIKNGRAKRKIKEKLIDNEYVFRPQNSGRVKNKKAPVGEQLIYDKFIALKELSGISSLCARDIRRSGMIRYAVDLSIKDELPIEKFTSKDHWRVVAERFNINHNVKNNCILYENITNHIKPADIYELYGEYEEYKDKIDEFQLIEGEAEKEFISRKKRVQSPYFRKIISDAYSCCAITGETFQGVLEACHIQPYRDERSNHIQNGLLLREDIHTLLDEGFIAIDENYHVLVSPLLQSPYYQKYHGKQLLLPKNSKHYPSKQTLAYLITEYRKC